MMQDGKMVNEHGEIVWGVQLKTPYNFDRDDASIATGLTCDEESMTQQQFKDECDINVIMERFGVTGELPQNVRQPLPEDFWDITDFQSAQNAIRAAQESFMEMPAGIRARFQNNPGIFMEYFADEKNRDEAERLGLVIQRKDPEPAPGPREAAAKGPEEG